MTTKVIAYEGFCGYLLMKPLARSLRKHNPDLEFESRSWLDTRPVPKDCLLIGHSFGGIRALINSHEPNKPAALVMVDPRWYKNNKDRFWQVPKRLQANAYSFYQKKHLLPGVTIGRCLNHKILDANHMSILNTEKLHDIVWGIAR